MPLHAEGYVLDVWETQRLDDRRRLKLLRLGIALSQLAISFAAVGVGIWLIGVFGPRAWRQVEDDLVGVAITLALIAYAAS
jgi:hypothetical protein